MVAGILLPLAIVFLNSPCAPRDMLRVGTWFLYGKRSEQFLHIGWKGAFEGQVFFRYRMYEAELGCVQGLTFEVQLIEYVSVSDFTSPVDRVAEQRMADGGHVDADLVGSAGLKAALHQS
jgi:hypothetical protein